MAAGLGFKDFTTGEVLTAADVDGYLMQGVWVFADAAARTAAVASPQEGNFSFLKDTNSTEYYNGAAWVAVGASSGLTLISNTTIGSGVTSVTVSTAFSSAYDNYKIVINGGVCSGGVDLSLKLGATATGYYAGITRVVYSTQATATSPATNNAATFVRVGAGSTDVIVANFELINPNLAKNTILNGWYADPVAGGSGGVVSGFLNDATQYTAFTIASGGNTLTGGTIRVYGYSNS